MAARKSKTSARKTAVAVNAATKLTDLTPAQIKKIDAECKKKGEKPLSFLAHMLQKTIKNVPALEKEIASKIRRHK